MTNRRNPRRKNPLLPLASAAAQQQASAPAPICTDCGTDIPAHVRSCMVCGRDAGFPNVRAAQRQEETVALAQRLQDAVLAARGKRGEAKLEEFRKAVAMTSTAVICRPVAKVHEFVTGDNELYASFHQLVEAWARLPEDNRWDRIRGSVDALFFPHYFAEIRFAVLSLDGQGMTGYGGLSIQLQDVAVKSRATVFEENTITFCEKQHQQTASPPPPGYRATWQARGDLSAAKLSAKITGQTTPADFPALMMSQTGGRDQDFIEVHIYGPIHRRAIERVSGRKPTRPADKVLLKAIESKLKEINVPVVVNP